MLRPIESNCTVRVGVILNNETDLALTIHFHLPIRNKGFMSTTWFFYGMNYAQNSIVNSLRGAWNVCGKNSTDKPDEPNFSQLILIIGSLK